MKAQYVDKDKFQSLYVVMQYENVLALRVSLETGIRISDVLSLKPENLRGRTISYTAMKTDKQDKKVISKHLADELRRNARGGWFFPGRKDGTHRTRQAVYTDLKKACAVIGIDEHLSPHSARKIMAVDYFHEHGLKETQKVLQHDRADTTMIYAFADLLTDGKTAQVAPKKSDMRWDSVDAFARQVARCVVDLLEERSLSVVRTQKK